MVLTALICLSVLGAVISWDRQLPRSSERWRTLPRKRKALSILAFPVGILATLVAAPLLTYGVREADGFYGLLTLLSATALVLGGGVLVVLAGWRLVRAR